MTMMKDANGNWVGGRPRSVLGGAPQVSGGMPMQGQESRGAIPGQPLINQQVTATPQAPTPSTGQGTFSNSSNLITSQYNPTPSARLTGVQGQADAARNAYASSSTPAFNSVAGRDTSGAQRLWGQAEQFANATGAGAGGGAAPSYGGPGGFGYNADTGDVRRMTLDQLKTVMNTTPDRATLAANTFKRLLDDTNPQYESELRSANQKNAAMGRRGSGMATTDLGDVTQRRNEQLIRRQAELADNAAALALSDQTDKLNASRGVGESFAGQDINAGQLNLSAANSAFGNSLASWEANQRARQNSFDNYRTLGQDQYGMSSDLYGDRVSERDKGYGAGMDRYNAGRSKMSDLYGVESQIAGDEAAQRNELRGERGYQYGLSQDATQNRINQYGMQEDVFGNDWRRAQDQAQMGYGMSPYDAYGTQATNYGNQAQNALGAGADLFSNWARRRAYGSQPSGPSGAPPQITIPDFQL
ncbi:MAG: hypothetical protein ACYC3L_01105 [Gemmatimonadaceae bacterium]